MRFSSPISQIKRFSPEIDLMVRDTVGKGLWEGGKGKVSNLLIYTIPNVWLLKLPLVGIRQKDDTSSPQGTMKVQGHMTEPPAFIHIGRSGQTCPLIRLFICEKVLKLFMKLKIDVAILGINHITVFVFFVVGIVMVLLLFFVLFRVFFFLFCNFTACYSQFS